MAKRSCFVTLLISTIAIAFGQVLEPFSSIDNLGEWKINKEINPDLNLNLPFYTFAPPKTNFNRIK